MIPHKIYYIWEGSNKPDDLSQKCIATWKQLMPEYEIVRIDHNCIGKYNNKFVQKALEAKAYSYLSDYLRLVVLYERGGIYFDTDVEMIRGIQDIVDKGEFFAISSYKNKYAIIATGLGFGVEKHNPLIKQLMKPYEKWDFDTFYNEKNFPNISNCVVANEQAFEEFGFKKINSIQEINYITFYPSEYFEPEHYIDGVLRITKNTRTIHHYLGKNKQSDPDSFLYNYRAKINKIFRKEVNIKIIKVFMAIFHPIYFIKYKKKHK